MLLGLLVPLVHEEEQGGASTSGFLPVKVSTVVLSAHTLCVEST
jgi:hypothetical protein